MSGGEAGGTPAATDATVAPGALARASGAAPSTEAAPTDLATVAGRAPTRMEILVATGVALGAAALLTVLFVLPAEHGIDPLGVGRLTGLGDLSAGRVLNVTDDGAPVHQTRHSPWNETEVTIVVAAGHGVEYKFHVVEDAALLYEWRADGAVYFDFHGEPDEGPPGAFASYRQGTAEGGSGELRAPFSGRHGWYFFNDGDATVNVRLRAAGHHAVVGFV